MDPNQIVAKFVELGLAEQEAKIYVMLARSGPQKAKDISKAIRLSKVQVYRNLQNLENRGFVDSSLGHPAIFSTISLEKAINLLIESKSSEVMLLKRSKEAIMSSLKMIEPNIPEEANKFSVIDNVNTVCSLINDFPNKNFGQLRIMINDWQKAIPDLEKFYKTLRTSIKKGSKYRLISANTRANRDFLEKFAKNLIKYGNFKEQFIEADPEVLPSFLLGDGRELILPVEKDNYGHISKAIVTNNRAMVIQAKFIFENMWRDRTVAPTNINLLHSYLNADLKPQFYSADYKINSWVFTPFMRCGNIDLSLENGHN